MFDARLCMTNQAWHETPPPLPRAGFGFNHCPMSQAKKPPPQLPITGADTDCPPLPTARPSLSTHSNAQSGFISRNADLCQRLATCVRHSTHGGPSTDRRPGAAVTVKLSLPVAPSCSVETSPKNRPSFFLSRVFRFFRSSRAIRVLPPKPSLARDRRPWASPSSSFPMPSPPRRSLLHDGYCRAMAHESPQQGEDS